MGNTVTTVKSSDRKLFLLTKEALIYELLSGNDLKKLIIDYYLEPVTYLTYVNNFDQNYLIKYQHSQTFACYQLLEVFGECKLMKLNLCYMLNSLILKTEPHLIKRLINLQI